MQEILNYSFFGNSVLKYLIALGIFIGGMAAAYVFRQCILTRLRRWAETTVTRIDDLLVTVVGRFFLPVFYFVVFYLSLNTLHLSDDFERGLKVSVIVLVTIVVVSGITSVINFALRSYLARFDDSEHRKRQLEGIQGVVNFIIWTVALIFLLDNLGVKISAAVAGLGIGGIAVALASQAILGDLFSYFVIFFDKPFEAGDFIIVDDKMGEIEHIGIKTTRIRALTGEQLVLSNTDLTNSRVHNYKRMEKRRVVFNLGVALQTPTDKLRAIPQMVREVVERQQDIVYDRGHLAAIGEDRLNFEFVYFVMGSDYTKYMDIQQAINLGILEAFEQAGIEIAYPTQTLLLARAQREAPQPAPG